MCFERRQASVWVERMGGAGRGKWEPTPRKWVLLVWNRRKYSAARVLSVAER
jgi:hypothetical protein